MVQEKVIDWPTPMSNWRSPEMILLTDDGRIRITFADSGHSMDRVMFCFDEGVQAYRNINESYQTNLWGKHQHMAGWTFILRPSNWIAELTEDPIFDSMFTLNKETIEHYVMATIDDVVELISFSPPKIESR